MCIYIYVLMDITGYVVKLVYYNLNLHNLFWFLKSIVHITDTHKKTYST
jgi:hypothetical protein